MESKTIARSPGLPPAWCTAAIFAATTTDLMCTGSTVGPIVRVSGRLLLARYVFDADNQTLLARKYGEWLTSGRTVQDVETVPERLTRVSADDVNRAARKYLRPERSVTGVLLPKPSGGMVAAQTAGAAK